MTRPVSAARDCREQAGASLRACEVVFQRRIKGEVPACLRHLQPLHTLTVRILLFIVWARGYARVLGGGWDPFR